MCGSMVDIQSPTAEIRRGKEEEEEEERNRIKYIWSALLHRATIKKVAVVSVAGWTGISLENHIMEVSLVCNSKHCL